MKNKKIMCLILIFLQIFIISSNVFAVEKGENVLLYSKEKLDGIEMNYYGQDVEAYYTVYSKDGIEYPAYCINYDYKGVTDEKSYSVQITEDYTNLGVWRAIINGYPFKTPEELGCANIQEAYAATKQAVFCMLYDRDFKWYSYNGEPGKRTYDAMIKIVEIARNSTQTQLDTKISLLEEDWQIDELDNEYLSKRITINCETIISKFDIKLKGNVPEGTIMADLNNNELEQFINCKEFKVLIPLKNLTDTSEFSLEVQAGVDSYPMYYGKAPATMMQDYVLTAGIIKQEYSAKLIQYPENKTKLIIEKKDLEEKVLSGVKFNILDSNNNIIFENIETNEYGIIELNNLLPGKYYIQETETLEGYEINNEIIEVELDLNEEEKVLITNEKIPQEPEEPEEPQEPEIPETPEIQEPPKLPRTGW